jgi:V8-like Glu-specific endopeptidase
METGEESWNLTSRRGQEMYSKLNLQDATICGLLILIAPHICGAQEVAPKAVNVSSFGPTLDQVAKDEKIDYVGATPFLLPIASTYSNKDAYRTMASVLGPQSAAGGIALPGSSTGGTGNGSKSPATLGAPKPATETPANARVLDFGTANLPFSTSRADLDPVATNDQYPYRAAGKLFFNVGSQSYTCSASLIKPGLVVTAGHCVADFGKNTLHSGWQFAPGYRDGVAPYGTWTVAQGFVMTSYLNGADSCQEAGVICQDDIAVLALNPQKDSSGKPYYVGQNTGWFSYTWDRSGYTISKITHVTELGYPGCLDNASRMERNDAQGMIDAAHSDNTIIGSLMCEGASGGPWLINFGVQPTLTGADLGRAPSPNQVIGVTSWGSTDDAVKWMGASPFLSTNIVVLVDAACKAYPDVCKD